MYHDMLVHTHSGLRWIVLILLLLVVIKSLPASGKTGPDALTKRISLFTLIAVHLNVVLGMILYMTSTKVQFSSATMGDSILRFFTVEHVIGMLIAVVLVTVAHRKSKADSLKGMFRYYAIALLIILLSIPWPFRGLGTGWF